MEHSGTNIELIVLGILGCTIAYSLLSKVVSQTILTLPIIFVGIGYLCAPVAQSLGTTMELRESARLLAELTLVLILFADASHVRFSGFKMTFAIPLRMLIIGLPGSIALGTLVVFYVFPAGGLALALLTAALLAPTDAAIGQAVVSSAKVPEHLSQSINVEGGLNDGLVLPFILLGAILASTNMADTDGLALFAATQVVLGPIVGLAIGWISAKSLEYAQQRDWIVESAQGIVFLSAAFVSFLAAVLVGGNGFIAAFVAGAVFGNTYRNDIHFIKEFMEGAGQLLTMATFLVFGALMLPGGLAHMTGSTVLVALLILTVVRVLPVLISLAGTGLPIREKLFLGWFGPRGLASILFTLIIMEEFELPNEEELLACVSLTVAFSVLLHGVSASPLAKRIGNKAGT